MNRSFLLSLAWMPILSALPEGGIATHGQIEMARGEGSLTIRADNRSIIQWQSFSIDPKERVDFNLPSAQSSVLNRVVGHLPSSILGQLSSNGQVLLINPNGILFGKEASVNVASLIASTLDIQDACYVEGRDLHFSGEGHGPIAQYGSIHTESGDLILIGSSVMNRGELSAQGGIAALLAAGEVVIKLGGEERIFIRPAMNSGKEELLQWLQEEEDLWTEAFFQETGKPTVYQAGQMVAEGATILKGDDAVLQEGSETRGSSVEVRAKRTLAYPGSKVNTDAHGEGRGGDVLIWGDEACWFLGDVFSRGGEISGDGGFVEISSPESLLFKGVVDATAVNGKVGTFLLDPSGITIAAATLNVALGNCGFSAITYASTAAAGTLDVATLNAQLGLTDVIITTANGTCGALAGSGDIIINGNISWSSTHSLTLNANHNIVVNAGHPINITGGSGSITFNATNQITLNSSLTQSGTGNIAFNATTILLNGAGGVSSAQSGNITATATAGITNNFPITQSGTGNISMSGTFLQLNAGAISITNAASPASINITASSTFITAGGTATITTAGTGPITLSAVGNIITNAPVTITGGGASALTITSTGGSINDAGGYSSNSSGDIRATASTTFTGSNFITQSGTGNIVIQSGGLFSLSGPGVQISNAASMGSITLTSTAGGMSAFAPITNSGLGSITLSSSGNFSANAAGPIGVTNAAATGSISITSTAGTITTSRPVTNAGSGNITYLASGAITTNGSSNISLTNAAQSGNITLTSTAGAISTALPVNTTGSGNITYNANTNVTINGAVQNSGTGGNITVTAVTGTVTTTGTGTVKITNGASLGAISFTGAAGVTIGGAVSNAGSGNITLMSPATVTTNAAGSIAVTNGAGGSILLQSTGAGISLAGAISSASNAGNVTLLAPGAVVTNVGGTIALTSGVSTGTISLTSTGSTVSTAAAITQVGVGDLLVSAQGNVTIGSTTLATGGDAVLIAPTGSTVTIEAAGAVSAAFGSQDGLTIIGDPALPRCQRSRPNLSLIATNGGHHAVVGYIYFVVGPNTATGPVDVTCNNLLVQGADTGFGEAYVGHASPDSSIFIPLITTATATIFVDAAGSIDINRGSGFSDARIGHGGRAMINTLANPSSFGGDICVSAAGSITLHTPTALAIGSGGIASIGHGATVMAGANPFPNANANISVQAGGDIALLNKGLGGAVINFGIGHLFCLNAVGDVEIIAGGNFIMSQTQVNNSFNVGHVTSGVGNTIACNIFLSTNKDLDIGPEPLSPLQTIITTQRCQIGCSPATLTSGSVEVLVDGNLNVLSSGSTNNLIIIGHNPTAIPVVGANTDVAVQGNMTLTPAAVTGRPIRIAAPGDVNVGVFGNIDATGTGFGVATSFISSQNTASGTTKIFAGGHIHSILNGANAFLFGITPTPGGSLNVQAGQDLIIRNSFSTVSGNIRLASGISLNSGDLWTLSSCMVAPCALPCLPPAQLATICTSPVVAIPTSGCVTCAANQGFCTAVPISLSVSSAPLAGGICSPLTFGSNTYATSTGNFALQTSCNAACGSALTIGPTPANNISIGSPIGSVTITGFGAITLNQALSVANAGTPLVLSTCGNLTISPGSNITATTAGAGVSLTSDSDLSGAGNISLQANVSTSNGPITLNAGFGAGVGTSSINQTAGALSSTGGAILAQALSDITFNGTAPTTVNAGSGNITATSQTGTIAVDQDVISTAGNIVFSAGTDIDVNPNGRLQTGGAGVISATAGRDILVNGDSPSITNGSGAITLSAVNAATIDKAVTSGSGPISITADSDDSGAGNLLIAANITTTTNSILLDAGFGAAAGTSAISQTAGAITTTGAGAITAQAVGDITINGAATSVSNGSGAIGMTSTAGSIQIDQNVVSGSGDVTLNAKLDANVNPGGLLQTGGAGVIGMTAGRDILVNGDSPSITNGSGAITLSAVNAATIDKAVTSGSGPIRITADSDDSGVGNATIAADVSTTGGAVQILAGSGASSGTSAINQTAGKISSGGGDITLTATWTTTICGSATSIDSSGGNIQVSSLVGNTEIDQIVTSLGGSIDVLGYDVTLGTLCGIGGMLTSTTGDIHVKASHNILVQGAPTSILSTSGNVNTESGNDTRAITNILTHGVILMIAGHSTYVLGTAHIHSTGNPVTLVVDNNFPTPPLIGPGFLFTEAGTSIHSGSPLLLYTALYQLNSISGLLNGLSYVPGTPYLNTPTEQWCTYYPNNPLGAPYTIYYKDCLQFIAHTANVIDTQVLYYMQLPFEYPGWIERYTVDGEPYRLSRRNLKVVNHPKTYTLSLLPY